MRGRAVPDAVPCADPSSQTAPKCGYRFPGTGDVWRAQNDRLLPLYEASTALFPSVYLSPNRSPAWTARNIDYVHGVTEESLRLATKGQPVRPFAWSQVRCHPLPLPSKFSLVVVEESPFLNIR